MAVPPGNDTVGPGMRMLPAGRVTAPALRGLSRFADARGVPAGREFLLDYDVIEAFCVAGLAGRASSTRGTYRSALYRLAEAAHGPAGQRATPFAGARAPAPYSPGERAELAAVAAAQRDRAKRSSALALVVFGIGAGLRPGELVALRGSDVTRHGRQVLCLCRAGRPRGWCRSARAMPAAPGSWPAARAAVSCSGPGRPAGPIRTSSPTSPGAWPRTRQRPACRCGGPGPAFICGHLAAGTPVGVLLAITGIAEAGSLARYARHVAGRQLLQGHPARALARGAHAMSGSGLALPPAGGGVSDNTVTFAAELIDRSGKAPVIEAALAHATGQAPPAAGPRGAHRATLPGPR